MHTVSVERRGQRVFTGRCKHPTPTSAQGPAAPRALPGSALTQNCSIKESLEADIGPGGETGAAKGTQGSRGGGGGEGKGAEGAVVGELNNSLSPSRKCHFLRENSGNMLFPLCLPHTRPCLPALTRSGRVAHIFFPPPLVAPRPPDTLPENEVYFVDLHYSPFSKLDSCH